MSHCNIRNAAVEDDRRSYGETWYIKTWSISN